MDLSSLKTPAPRGDRLRLVKGRMHEVSGRGALTFALAQAAQIGGKVALVWPSWERGVPMAQGIGPLVENLIHIRAQTEMDVLWAIEECLRSTAVTTVISKPKKALNLTQGRRFQLAAAEGGTTGIMIIERGAGCPAAETRWECEPCPSAHEDEALHRWALVKDKKGPEAAWEVIGPPCFEESPRVRDVKSLSAATCATPRA